MSATTGAATENDRAARKAAIASYLDRDQAAARRWRAHQWMVEVATTEQIAAAVDVAAGAFLEAKNDSKWLDSQLKEHNRARAIVGMPAASPEEFDGVLFAFYIHIELLNAFANGIEH